MIDMDSHGLINLKLRTCLDIGWCYLLKRNQLANLHPKIKDVSDFPSPEYNVLKG